MINTGKLIFNYKNIFKSKKGMGWRLLATMIIAIIAAAAAVVILWKWLGKFV
jgi:hypothetical protein